LVIGAHGEGEIDPAFATLVKQGAGAVLISPDALFTGRRDQTWYWRHGTRYQLSTLCANTRWRAA
jgi:hypothetical protein